MAEIRPYITSDHRAVEANLRAADMYDEVWDTPENLASMTAQNPNAVLVATEDEEVVGSVVMTPFGADVAFIWRLVVNEKYRRHGIGTQLLDSADSILRAAGVKEIAIFIDPKKEGLQDYYDKRDYLTYGNAFLSMWKPID